MTVHIQINNKQVPLFQIGACFPFCFPFFLVSLILMDSGFIFALRSGSKPWSPVTQLHMLRSQVALVGLGCSPAAVCGPITKLVHREDSQSWGGLRGGWAADRLQQQVFKQGTITKWSGASVLLGFISLDLVPCWSQYTMNSWYSHKH